MATATKHTAKTKKNQTPGRMQTGANKTARKLWVAAVTTDSTHPPTGLFTKRADAIARALASKKVSPKGPASGMRMLNYFMNRAGRGLSWRRRSELEKAKTLLSERIRRIKSSRQRQTG